MCQVADDLSIDEILMNAMASSESNTHQYNDPNGLFSTISTTCLTKIIFQNIADYNYNNLRVGLARLFKNIYLLILHTGKAMDFIQGNDTLLVELDILITKDDWDEH